MTMLPPLKFARIALVAVGLAAFAAPILRADDSLKHFQQSLRDQGFYYGSVDGSPGDETTQAIRRYQIRNGLAVTGQLDDDTRHSIDKTGAALKNGDRAAADSTPGPLATPPPPRNRPSAPPALPPAPTAPPEEQGRPRERPDLRAGDGPAAPPPANAIAPSAALTAFFRETPFEFAPPPVQADVLRRAQTTLMRSGFYDGASDGRPGPDTSEALSNFQEVARIRRTGRLDSNTLAALHLLPARRAPGAVRY